MRTESEQDAFSTTELRYGGKWTCTACPVQAEGRLGDGRPWYFRARHDVWSLCIGEPGAEDAVWGQLVDEGLDPWGGFMPAGEAATRIHKALDWYLNAHLVCLSGCTETGGYEPWRHDDARLREEPLSQRVRGKVPIDSIGRVATSRKVDRHGRPIKRVEIHNGERWVHVGYSDDPRCTASSAVLEGGGRTCG